MNVIEVAGKLYARPRQLERAATTHRLPVYLITTALCLLSNYLADKDVSWDLLDYHLYAGFSALHDRFSQDYFAAGLQSYLNPYVYVPFYLLIKTGLPALAVSSILAACHSVVLWLVFEIALELWPSTDQRGRLMVGLCAIGLAFINPILLQQIGSDFSDVLTAEVSLGGWLLLVKNLRAPTWRLAAAGGALLGAATALKLTNSVHAIAAFVLLLFVSRPWRTKLSHAMACGIAFGMAVAFIEGPWAYRLAHMFGNPFFPLLNNVFRSPACPIDPIVSHRFIPANLWAALWRPFALLDPTSMVQEEDRVPDLRYALLVVLGVAALVQALWRRRSRAVAATQTFGTTAGIAAAGATNVQDRILAALAAAFAVDWVLWLKASGNGRYFLAGACIAGVVATGLLFRYLRPQLRNCLILAVFAAQTILLWSGTDFRWYSLPWDGQWLRVSMPQRLATESYLFLTIGMQSESFLVPYFASGSGMVDFAGGYAIGPEGVNGARVQALIERYGSHLRMLVFGRKLVGEGDGDEPKRSEVDGALARFGLRVDPSDCATIGVDGLPHPTWLNTKGSRSLAPQTVDRNYFLSCRVISAQWDRAAYESRLRAANSILDKLEQDCPGLFRPRGLRTDDNGTIWERSYMNTDLVAMIKRGRVEVKEPMNRGRTTALGTAAEWERNPPRLSCGRHPSGDYFVAVASAR